MKFVVVALALAAVAAPGLPRAQAAPPTIASTAGLTERDRLTNQLTHEILLGSGVDIAAEMRKEAGGLQHMFEGLNGRPEWGGMFLDAAEEEVRTDMPRIEQVLGRTAFAPFTIAELQAGSAFLTASVVREAVEDTRRGGKGASLSPASRKALTSLSSTVAGRGFLAKFGKLHIGDTDKSGVVIGKLIAPGALRRFGEKAQAAEAARAAAAPAPSEADLLGAQLMHRMIGPMGLQAKLDEIGEALGKSFGADPDTAEWGPVAQAAGLEEIRQDAGLVETCLGRQLGRRFSVEELRAGIAFLDTAAGQDVLAGMAQRAAGGPERELTKADRKAIDALRKTPAGDGFMRKLGALDQVNWTAGIQDFLIAFFPGALRRFGEKLEAQQVAIQAVS